MTLLWALRGFSIAISRARKTRAWLPEENKRTSRIRKESSFGVPSECRGKRLFGELWVYWRMNNLYCSCRSRDYIVGGTGNKTSKHINVTCCNSFTEFCSES